jgi:hypothetical protein
LRRYRLRVLEKPFAAEIGSGCTGRDLVGLAVPIQQETTDVLDVHPPNEPVHSWRDFFIHIATITIGLLIALSLERCVEWQHHRHLAHETKVSLGNEIRGNSKELPVVLGDVDKELDMLKQDLAVLNRILASPKKPNREDINVYYKIRWFNDVSWRTAQKTTVLSYLPYDEALEYSDIYDQQDEIDTQERLAVRDVVVGIAPLQNLKHGDLNPTGDEAAKIKEHFQILQGQLQHIRGLIEELDGEYKKYLAAHPE